jgi:ATP-dependent Lon protease
MALAQQMDSTDFHVEAIDLLGNQITCEAGVALVVAIFSALRKTSVKPALIVLGDLSIQGNIKPVLSLAEPLQLGMDNGARRALIPLENKRHFFEVTGDILEQVDPIFYGDPQMAAMKAMGFN